MAPKSAKKIKSAPTTSTGSDTDLFLESEDSSIAPRCVSLTLILKGNPPGHSPECTLFAIFNGIIVLEGKWNNDEVLESETLPINLYDPTFQTIVANTPLFLLLRAVGGKGTKDPDPLAHPDNRAGASVDLFPLLLGEQKILITSDLVSMSTGEKTGCSVIVRAISLGTTDHNLVPLVITMISVHCLPVAKEGTFYLSAIGLNGVHEQKAVNFNVAVSTPSAEKIVFAAVSTGGHGANTAMNVHTEDKFIPNDLQPQDEEHCRSVYWNAMVRVLVDPKQLFERLSSPFMIEVAGLPGKSGKIDIRGRYMGLVDARVLLEPGQTGVTVCSKLLLFNEADTPDNIGALLELPPTSAKTSAREADNMKSNQNVTDVHGHSAYAVIRFDLTEALVPNTKLENLYEFMRFPPPEDAKMPFSHSDFDTVQDNSVIDARNIRTGEGALAVHKELSGLACKGTIPMNQGIKRTAANRLLMRVRAMLKNFSPGECSYIDWEKTVTGQHAASRRAVTASFAPQPPPPRLPDIYAAARSRIAGDTRIADRHLETSLKVAGSHPRSIISKTLRCLEDRNDTFAKNYLLEAISRLTRNKYLLWIFGGLEFDKGNESADIAGAALRIAIKGDYSDGTVNSIGWAALHTFHHCNGNMYAAFVAAKKMRKAFSLPTEWDKVIERWTEASGEEEIYWMPEFVSADNPILMAAAFFLCLRCYKFSERLLQCFEQGCASRGSVGFKDHINCDMYYLRAASLILRRQPGAAMEKTIEGIHKFGPSPKMSQMQASCLTYIRNWDRECEKKLQEVERTGSELCSSLLYSAALSSFKLNPMAALQRAARAHKNNPSGHTALLIGRIYAALGKEWFAERWLAAAVNTEPLLADGWAMLALLAMYDRNLDKARVMLRTARQAGPLSPDIDEEVKKVMEIVELDQLPDSLVKNLCLCDYK